MITLVHIIDAVAGWAPGEGPAWRSSCSCGWRGAYRPTYDLALAEGDEHAENAEQTMGERYVPREDATRPGVWRVYDTVNEAYPALLGGRSYGPTDQATCAQRCARLNGEVAR